MNKISIRYKLILIILFTNVIIVGLGVGLETYYNKLSLKKRYKNDIGTNAKRVGIQCGTALDFNFAQDAKEILETLRPFSEIKHAFIYDTDNNLFVEYQRDTTICNSRPKPTGKSSDTYSGDILTIEKPIVYRKEAIGSIIVVADTEISKIIQKQYIILGLAALVLLFISFLLAGYLQKFISEPILKLSEVVNTISEKKDYSIRIENKYYDEIGTLNLRINNFLNIIQNREIERDKAENALRLSEERFRSLAEMLPETVFEVDSNLNFSFINKAAQTTFDYSTSEIKHLNFHDIIVTHDYPKLKKTIKALMKDSKPLSDEYTAVKKTGKVFPALIYVSPIYYNKALTGFRGILIDFSELKAAQNEIEKLNKTLENKVIERTKKLKKANKELEEVSYISAHDLKTPIRGITQLSEWMLEDYDSILNNDLKQRIRLLLNRANHMNNLVNGILEYISIGKADIKVSRFSLNEIITQIKQEIKQTNVKINLHGENLNLCFSQDHIYTLFKHLITNGIKFNEQAEKVIDIYSLGSEECPEFMVKDNGIGIEDKYMHKIFRVFNTLSSDYSGEGIGIGLPIVKKIIELYKGSFTIDSRKGEGTKFMFNLKKYCGANEEQ